MGGGGGGGRNLFHIIAPIFNLYRAQLGVAELSVLVGACRKELLNKDGLIHNQDYCRETSI